MMITSYRLSKNTRVISENDDMSVLMDVAATDAGKPLTWKDCSEVNSTYQFAFDGVGVDRKEYEITSFRKRTI
jgi:hypothetical protein